MTINNIYNQFIKPTKENFPIEFCTKQNKKEPEVYDSDTPFMCLVIDKRFDNYWYLIILYPYICKEKNENITFGWVDRSRNVYSNIENSTQLWDEFVVGFQRYDLETEDSYKELWSNFIKNIENQYDD